MSATVQGYTRGIGNCFQSFVNNTYDRITTYYQETSTKTKIKQIAESIIAGLACYAVLNLTNISLLFGITHLQWSIGIMVYAFALNVLGIRPPCAELFS